MTEPDYPGSNPVWMGTTAVKDGDDYVINGRQVVLDRRGWRGLRDRDGGDQPRRAQPTRARA